MPHCVAFECSIQAKNRKKDPKIRFHKFPDDAAIRRAWIHAVGRTSLPKVPRLCSKHFEEHCFEESYLMEVKLMGSSNSTKSLKTGAIPTLFSHKPPKGGRASSVQRAEKREREIERLQASLICYSNTKTNRLWFYLNSSFITFV